MATISWNNFARPGLAEIEQYSGAIYGMTPVAPVEGTYEDLLQPTLSRRVRWRATGASQCAAFTLSVDPLAAGVLVDAAFVAGLLDVVQPFGLNTDPQGYNARLLSGDPSFGTTFDSLFNPSWGSFVDAPTAEARGRQSYKHNLYFTSSPPFQPAAQLTFVIPLGRTIGGLLDSGDFSIAGLWLGAGLEFDGVDSTWQVSVDDASRVAESEGRQSYSSGGSIVDTMQCSISVQEQEKTLMSLGEPYSFRRWIREVGVSRPTVILPRTSDETSMVELGIHGLIQGRAPRIAHQGDGWHRVETFTIKALR